ncbi:MAG: Spy/CpxP family protein refolding chaperone [Deltaproteobacteria bacterium]
MKTQLYLPLLLALVCSLTSLAYGGEKGIKWWKNQEIVAELNLSSGQVSSIENIFASTRDRLISLTSELRQKEGELGSLIRDPNATQQQVLTLTNEVEGLKGELRKSEVRMFLEIRDVLNSEQREMLHKIKGRYR